MGYQEDRKMERLYMPMVIEKLAWLKPRLATVQEDVNHATDLVAEDGRRIAVRVRRHELYARYHADITIRYSRDSVPTEAHKVALDSPYYYYYGFLSDDCSRLCAHRLLLYAPLIRGLKAKHIPHTSPRSFRRGYPVAQPYAPKS